MKWHFSRVFLFVKSEVLKSRPSWFCSLSYHLVYGPVKIDFKSRFICPDIALRAGPSTPAFFTLPWKVRNFISHSLKLGGPALSGSRPSLWAETLKKAQFWKFERVKTHFSTAIQKHYLSNHCGKMCFYTPQNDNFHVQPMFDVRSPLRIQEGKTLNPGGPGFESRQRSSLHEREARSWPLKGATR